MDIESVACRFRGALRKRLPGSAAIEADALSRQQRAELAAGKM
jgi:hypothetical protein